MNELKRDLRRRILRMLADHPEGLTPADFRCLMPETDTRQQAQTRAGNALRALECATLAQSQTSPDLYAPLRLRTD